MGYDLGHSLYIGGRLEVYKNVEEVGIILSLYALCERVLW